MPYPLLAAIGAGLAVGGAGMQVAGESKARHAMKAVRNAENARQRQFQKDATGVLNDNIATSGVDDANADLASGEAARVAAYQSAQAQVGQPMSQSGDANAVIRGSKSKANDQTNAWVNARNFNRAKLGAYDDYTLNQGVRNLRGNQKLAAINRNAAGSIGAMQFEMDSASHAGDKLNNWGQGTSAIGSILGMAGAMGYGPMIGGASKAVAANPWVDAGSRFTRPTAGIV